MVLVYSVMRNEKSGEVGGGSNEILVIDEVRK